MQPYVYSSTINNSKDMETNQIPIKRGMDEETVAHLIYGILHSY